MTGLPTGEEFEASLCRLHGDTLRQLAEAETADDKKQIRALRGLKARSDKLLRQRGIDPGRLDG